MENIQFHLIKLSDKQRIELISQWYLNEWNIPMEDTLNKINNLSLDRQEFQILMTLNQEPIATGGIYRHVGLIDKLPHLKMYKNWLALVYTLPSYRGKGYGAKLCQHIKHQSIYLGLQEIYLFTHTAENLYTRLGWQVIERQSLGGKDIAVMKG